MTSATNVRFREASIADVPAMAQCRLADPTDNGMADSRMAAYFACQHHPQQALPPRVGYVALHKDEVVGYIAGHCTTRNGCSGEVQYLFVAPEHRRQGLGTSLLRLLAEWFVSQGAKRVCVPIAADSPMEAKPFCEAVGATPLQKNWYAWQDIGTLVELPAKIDELRKCVETSGARDEKARGAAEIIRRSRGYRWVGLYDVGPAEISVIAWNGPSAPTYPRFPITSGLNGAAVASGQPVIVQDVTQDPRYLTTFGTTKAEMIVPVRGIDDRVVGTIDVESGRTNAFTQDDSDFLEACASVLLPLWSR